MAIFLSCAPALPFRNFPRFSHPEPAGSWHRIFLQTIYKWKELKSFILLSGAGKLMLLVQTKFNFYFIDYCCSSQSSFWLSGCWNSETTLPHISASNRKHWPDECEGAIPSIIACLPLSSFPPSSKLPFLWLSWNAFSSEAAAKGLHFSAAFSLHHANLPSLSAVFFFFLFWMQKFAWFDRTRKMYRKY